MSDGVVGVRAFARRSGFDLDTVRVAMVALGVRSARVPGRCGAVVAPVESIDPADAERLLVYLLARPLGSWTVRPGMRKAARGAWGCAGKPVACVDHGDATRPHYALGRCESCYRRRRYVGRAG